MSQFRSLGDRLVHRGSVVSFVERSIETPDGLTVVRDVVTHPGAVSVVPVNEGGEVILVSQYRAALDRVMWEIPAGKLDVVGEDLEEAARRELLEEVGVTAGRLEPLISFHNSPGFCDELQHTFLARDLTEVGADVQGIEEEHMVVRAWHLAEALAAVSEGLITDAKTVIGLILTARRLDEE